MFSRNSLPLSFLFTLFIVGLMSVPTHAQSTARQSDPKSQTLLTPTSLITEDLTGSLTPEDLATALVGTGVSVSNVSYTGADIAAGSFTDGDSIIGFESGIILSSGAIANVIGPNVLDNVGTDNELPGDPELDAISGFTTFDASVLEFDFVPSAGTVFFRFVFSSDEYNEFVNSSYNDVFAFLVNGENCATVEGDPVSINTINYGNPFGTEPNSHPELFINNDLSDGGATLDTEMDGLTHVLTCSAAVTPNQTNTMKLAIADATDHVYDSAVFLEAASLVGGSVIELTGLEITQGIQNWENSVELVENKPTFVRAHVRSLSSTVYNVETHLIGRRNGTILPESPLSPLNWGGNIDVLENPNRSVLSDSFYFELPQSWLNGTVELELIDVTHSINCKEHASTDNDCKAEVSFLESPSVDIRLVGIIWEEDNTEHRPSWADKFTVRDEIEALYPVPELTWDSPYDIKPAFFAGQPTSALEFLRLHAMLLTQRTLDGCISSWPVNCTRYYLGVLIDPPSSGVVGLGKGDIASGYITTRFTPSHELAHALGRRHTACIGNEAGSDPNYPYTGGKISEEETGDNAFFGFNILTRAIYGPSIGDLMSYCGPPRWPSDWTYENLRYAIVDHYGSNHFQPQMILVDEPAIVVSGIVAPAEETGEITSVLATDSPTSVAVPEPGPYSLRFEDSTGQVLASYSFIPDAYAHEGDGELPQTFVLLLPRPENLNRIVLLEGNMLLDDRVASNNAPSVTLISPSGGEIWGGDTALIEWLANDADSDSLEYTIQYSIDGGSSWLTLVTNWPTTTYEVNLENIAGSNQALIRVLASDGFLTAQDESQNVFTVNKHDPVPSILAPEDGSLFVGEQLIILRGKAQDAEDGQLDDAALTWQSSLDGTLGSGKVLAISNDMLSEGTHIISLVATDNDGQIATSSMTIDVYYNRPTLPKRLVVGPEALSFILIEGSASSGEGSLSIRNIGDGTISWSAEVDQSWISLSVNNGFSPADIVMTADATGLPIGVYTGTIVITASDALDSPKVITIELIVRDKYKTYLPVLLNWP